MQSQILYSQKKRPGIRLLPDTLFTAHLMHCLLSCTTHCFVVRFFVQYSSYSTVSVAPKCVQMNASDAFQTDYEMNMVMQGNVMFPVADHTLGGSAPPAAARRSTGWSGLETLRQACERVYGALTFLNSSAI